MDHKTLFPELKIKMPLYEVRCHDKIEWREISEVEVLGNIQETFDSVTPSVQDMIRGKPVVTPDAIYRLKDNQK